MAAGTHWRRTTHSPRRLCGKQHANSGDIFSAVTVPQAIQPQQGKRQTACRIAAWLIFGHRK
jgi:hypothetical protein